MKDNNSIIIIIKPLNNNSELKRIFNDADYAITHNSITNAKLLSYSEKDNTIKVKVELSNKVNESFIQNTLLDEINITFVIDDKYVHMELFDIDTFSE